MRYTSNLVRFAIISDIDHESGIVHTVWLDKDGEEGPDVPIPHPYAGRGGDGIFVAPKAGQILALVPASYERYVVASTVPMRAFYEGDLGGVAEIGFDDIAFPFMEDGDIVIQGKTGSYLRFDNSGDIDIKNSFGEGKLIRGNTNISTRCSITVNTPLEYTVSQSGLHAKGIIRRDIRVEGGDDDFVDFLFSPESEHILEEVGWNPNRDVTYITRDITAQGSAPTQDKSIRNPGLMEDRKIILEYGRDWVVGTEKTEISLLENEIVPIVDTTDRRERRSNVLSLSLYQPNELIETVSGTLVDIFGNLLDINRDIIPIPETNGPDLVKTTIENMRHTVAYHMEINTRKGWDYRGIDSRQSPTRKPSPPFSTAPNPLISDNNSRDRGKWSIDIDKEGLTKINIPASSETGNVPFLTRYETSSTIEVDSDGNVKNSVRDEEQTRRIFRNTKNLDVLVEQVGPGGIVLEGKNVINRFKGKSTSWIGNSQRTMSEFVQAGTAFHDITLTASTLIEQNVNVKSANIFDSVINGSNLLAVSGLVNNKVPVKNTEPAQRDPLTGLVVDKPNAGGRSLNINLDGSLETSIGANTVDRVSWIMDTAGGVVARLGRDRQGRSSVIQADGYMLLEVGGFDYIGEDASDRVDTRFVGGVEKRKDSLPGDPKQFRAGKVIIRVRRANPAGNAPDVDNDDTFVIIDDAGIAIKTAGRMNFISDQDIRFQTPARIVLEAAKIQMYEDNPKFVRRDGRNV